MDIDKNKATVIIHVTLYLIYKVAFVKLRNRFSAIFW